MEALRKHTVKPFVWNKKDQTDGRVRGEEGAFFHSEALLLPELFSSRGAVSLVQMLGFHVWLEHFHSLSDSLLLMDNGRGWALSGCQTLKLVCTKQRLRRVRLAGSTARWGFKRLILAMLWLVKCVEIICDSGQRVSCGRGGHTRLAHTSAPNRKKKRKKKKGKEAARVTSAVDRAVEPVCGRES